MNIFWFIPTHGDSRYLGTSKGARQVDHAYMKQIAVAVDNLGYDGVLIPTGRSCEDPWITAASLIDATRQLKFLVALRPGITTPALAARMAATFDRLSNGRILLNLVTGGDEQELKGDGLYEDHSTRYQTASEYVKIWREILTRSHTGESFTFHGERLSVDDAKLLYPPVQQPHPPLWFGGSSEAATELAAEQVDTYLTWGEPPAAVKEKIEYLRAKAVAKGRTLTYGIRLHVIVRETNEQAWAASIWMMPRLPQHRRNLRKWIQWANNAWRRCMVDVKINLKCPRIFGQALVWFAVVQARHWWVTQKRWLQGFRSMRI